MSEQRQMTTQTIALYLADKFDYIVVDGTEYTTSRRGEGPDAYCQFYNNYGDVVLTLKQRLLKVKDSKVFYNDRPVMAVVNGAPTQVVIPDETDDTIVRDKLLTKMVGTHLFVIKGKLYDAHIDNNYVFFFVSREDNETIQVDHFCICGGDLFPMAKFVRAGSDTPEDLQVVEELYLCHIYV